MKQLFLYNIFEIHNTVFHYYYLKILYYKRDSLEHTSAKIMTECSGYSLNIIGSEAKNFGEMPSINQKDVDLRFRLLWKSLCATFSIQQGIDERFWLDNTANALPLLSIDSI